MTKTRSVWFIIKILLFGNCVIHGNIQKKDTVENSYAIQYKNRWYSISIGEDIE